MCCISILAGLSQRIFWRVIYGLSFCLLFACVSFPFCSTCFAFRSRCSDFFELPAGWCQDRFSFPFQCLPVSPPVWTCPLAPTPTSRILPSYVAQARPQAGERGRERDACPPGMLLFSPLYCILSLRKSGCRFLHFWFAFLFFWVRVASLFQHGPFPVEADKNPI